MTYPLLIIVFTGSETSGCHWSDVAVG